MNLETNIIYTQQMPSFRVPGMTQEQTIEWFCSGRQCGVALEDIIAFQFDFVSSTFGRQQVTTVGRRKTLRGIRFLDDKVEVGNNLTDCRSMKIGPKKLLPLQTVFRSEQRAA